MTNTEKAREVSGDEHAERAQKHLTGGTAGKIRINKKNVNDAQFVKWTEDKLRWVWKRDEADPYTLHPTVCR